MEYLSSTISTITGNKGKGLYGLTLSLQQNILLFIERMYQIRTLGLLWIFLPLKLLRILFIWVFLKIHLITCICQCVYFPKGCVGEAAQFLT